MKKTTKRVEEAAAALANRDECTGSCDQPGSESTAAGGVCVTANMSRVFTDVDVRACACLSDGICPPGQQVAAELHDANKTSKSACSLKVTIQQGGASRAFTQTDETDAERAAGAGLRCHMCGVTCRSAEVFEEHMTGSAHVTKCEAITHSINVITHTLTNRRRRWCDTCQTDFSDDVISHRQSKRHKACKRASRPFCAACGRHLKTPRKFVEHMKSDKHKRQLRVKAAQEEELITVDAIGCFEEEAEPKQEVELGHQEKDGATSQATS